MRITGKAWVYGDNVDTDCITPSRYLDRRFSGPEWAQHCLEDLDPRFAREVKPGDFIVAGRNFGCGSSRESAPAAIKHSGVNGVIAKSFARIFFRNCVNIGLLPLMAPDAVDGIQPGQQLAVDLDAGRIENLDTGVSYRVQPVPPFLQEILQAGGLIPYLKQQNGIAG